MALVCVVALIATVPPRHALTYNASASMPVGLYEIRPVDRAIARGDTIMICAPHDFAVVGAARKYLLPGSCRAATAPLLKLVAAVEGDVVDLGDASIAVNGRCLRSGVTFVRDGFGRPLARVRRGRYRLRRHELWLWAPGPRSLDSRYFGPLDERDVLRLARPLFIRPPTAAGLAFVPCHGVANRFPKPARHRTTIRRHDRRSERNQEIGSEKHRR